MAVPQCPPGSTSLRRGTPVACSGNARPPTSCAVDVSARCNGRGARHVHNGVCMPVHCAQRCVYVRASERACDEQTQSDAMQVTVSSCPLKCPSPRVRFPHLHTATTTPHAQHADARCADARCACTCRSVGPDGAGPCKCGCAQVPPTMWSNLHAVITFGVTNGHVACLPFGSHAPTISTEPMGVLPLTSSLAAADPWISVHRHALRRPCS